MAIRKAVATTVHASSNSWAVNLPAGTVAGDLLLVWINMPASRRVDTPAGWTRVTYNVGPGGALVQMAFYKVATGTEGATQTFLETFGQSMAGTSVAVSVAAGGFRASQPVQPLQETATYVRQSTVGATFVDAPSIDLTSTSETLFGVVVRSVAALSLDAQASMSEFGQVLGAAHEALGAEETIAAAGPSGTRRWTGGAIGAGQEFVGSIFPVNPPNRAPNAPNLIAPANASTLDVAVGPTFSWQFVDGDAGDNQTAYYLRRKVGAGAYEYWNAGTAAWQAGEVKNTSSSASVTFAVGKWAVNTYNWSIATEDAAGVKGPYATDRTVTFASKPVVTVTAPTGVITNTSRPPVDWSITQAEAQPQQSYSAAVFTAAQYGIGGFNPATSPATWRKSEVTAVQGPVTPDVDLPDDTTYRAYVQVTAAGLQSDWAFLGFSLDLVAPTAPTITATPGTHPTTGAPRVAIEVTKTHNAATYPNYTFKVEASDDGGATWATIRDGDAVVHSGGTATVYDYAMPNKEQRLYRAFTVADV